MIPGTIYQGASGRLYAKTGEVRCLKTGEYYLNPTMGVCYTSIDFAAPYPIVREVEVDVPATYRWKE